MRLYISLIVYNRLPIERLKMSYDIRAINPITQEPIQFAEKHTIIGGTYEDGGCTEAWLNITYNYAPHFYKVFGENGIRILYGKTMSESITLINDALPKLSDDTDPNYWKATEGNAKLALINLMALAIKVMEATFNTDIKPTWSGD